MFDPTQKEKLIATDASTAGLKTASPSNPSLLFDSGVRCTQRSEIRVGGGQIRSRRLEKISGKVGSR